jgi:hypothetical protein
MSTPEQNGCRIAAAECLEMARLTANPETRRALLTMAQEWLKLAYFRQIANFEHIVTDYNARQMGGDSPARQS